MGNNRLEELFRDPTLERPTTDFFSVRTEWRCLLVSRETAARVLAAMSGSGPPKLVRMETVTGSVAWVRTDTILLVEESTRAQRDAQRRLWKALDEEENEDQEPLL